MTVALKDKLDVWSRDLIDMSKRNSLLYYRDSGFRPSGLALLEADPAWLFERLVRANRIIEQSALRLPDPETDPAPLRRLERLRVQARDDLKEGGVQTLYMVFGMLDWNEVEHSDERILSPLILAPIVIRQLVRGDYTIAMAEDEQVEINPSLREKLEYDFHLALPDWDALIMPRQTADMTAAMRGSTSAIPTLAVVLSQIRDALRKSSDTLTSSWSIADRVCLGRFSFTKLVMRDDLLRNEAAALAHPALRRIAGDRAALSDPKGLITADKLDERVRAADTLDILDADSSQEEAIQAAITGQSFVLQGPPGTGKSQTIANIIAESLARRRSVLFVSEKMAALDVVRKRLTEHGLGEFLLDLHDAKRKKKDFIGELQATVRQAQVRPREGLPTDWARQSADLERRREQLNSYVAELHKPRYALSISAFSAHGEVARHMDVPATSATLANAPAMSASDLRDRRDALNALLGYNDVLDTFASHMWRATPLRNLSGEQMNALDAQFGQLSSALGRAHDALGELGSRLGEDAPITLDWASYAQDRARLALTSPLPPRHWLDPSCTAQLTQTMTQGAAGSRAYQDARQQLDERYQDAIYALDHDAILTDLTAAPQPALRFIQTLVDQDPRDTALRERPAFESHLSACESLLPQIATSAKAAAELLGAPAPATIAEACAVAEQAAVVASSPMPPKDWLDADRYAEARVAALEATERAGWANQTRASLEQRYTTQFFTTDLSAISTRFRERYTSLLRYLDPQYYLDCRALRQLALPASSLSRSDLTSDALLIAKLHDEEQWARDNRALHARVFGRYYNGDHTDWTKVREMLAWADRFHGAFGERAAPEAVVRLVTGPSSEREPLSNVSRSLDEQAATWRAERAWTDQALTLDQRTIDVHDPGHASIASLVDTFARLHTALSALWRATDSLTATLRAPAALACAQMERDLLAARAAHDYTNWISEQADDLRRNLHQWFAGAQTDWDAASRNLEWARSFIALYPDGIPSALVAWIAVAPNSTVEASDLSDVRVTVQRALDKAESAITTIRAATEQTVIAIAPDALAGGPQPFDRTALERLRERADTLRVALPQLKRWVDCGEAFRRCAALGLEPLVKAFLGAKPFQRNIVQVFERQFYTLWLDVARHETPILGRFNGDNQASVIRAFRDLDREHIALASARLVNTLRQLRYNAHSFANRPATNPSDIEFVEAYARLAREVEKKRHPSIREIVRRVSPALRELKPCWMMSPLSVSQFIETAEPIFDLVIFDEASQVLPEDATCAIMRGKQLIVVGDDKQLPPTSFFSKSLGDDGDGDEETESAESERTQSILQELMGARFSERSLLWHYRSRHESLIAFSNSQFYDGRLITFPGPAADHSEGVKFVYVADGVYDRSGSRTNRREAERVVDELFAIVARDQPSSIGVVALSAAQQGAIRDALENRFKTHPELAYARDRLDEDSDAENAFFIKNLETVQGDERDIIVLSIGYGKDSKGAIYRNFGPINRDGGERRLNVAVTRARERMIVVSSMHASDLPLGQTSAGAVALRRYLDFAERGPKALRDAPTGVHGESTPTFDSPFEEAVYNALTKRGLRLDTQVGCSGYRIDLAVRDDQDPERYLLGIECDGATYHSSKTARDRDRLRQAHLETLSWHIHRIWSSDWIADPNREIAKTLDALRLIRMRSPLPQAQEGAS